MPLRPEAGKSFLAAINSPMRTSAQMRRQKARHQDRAEDGGGRDSVEDGAGEYDRTHDTGQVHRESGFVQDAAICAGAKS